MCWCPLMLPSQWSDIWLNQIPTDLKGTGVHLRRADRQAIWRQVDSIMLWQRDLQCDRQVGLVFFHADRCYWAREADRPVKGSFTVHPSLFSKWCLCDGPEGVCDFHISLAFEFITVLAMDGVGGEGGVCWQCWFIQSSASASQQSPTKHHYSRVTIYVMFHMQKGHDFFRRMLFITMGRVTMTKWALGNENGWILFLQGDLKWVQIRGAFSDFVK